MKKTAVKILAKVYFAIEKDEPMEVIVDKIVEILKNRDIEAEYRLIDNFDKLESTK